MVTCGSQVVADHVTELGTAARLIPTVVDTSRFRPGTRAGVGDLVTVGWIGSHSTYPYLADLFGVLRDVAAAVPFRLLVIGGGRQVPEIRGVTVEQRDWTLEGEVGDFQSLDIGLYPLRADGWAQGKSGLKAIQYMSVGVPFVATPVGATADLGLLGATHLLARSRDEWYEALRLLLEDHQLRGRMGTAGREHALEHYTIANAGRVLEQALRDSCSPARGP
jgi:glycosyltransferase involved in cell wall biosynthesis